VAHLGGRTDVIHDVAVIGGGVNGAGIARDAAGRGLSVVLVEQDDLAAHTSSASTKLVHGGLRYLEHYEFALVRKALQERERLLRAAPHIMWPLRFVMPHDASMRPRWLIRAGLFLYDHLASRSLLAASRSVSLGEHPAGAALLPQWTHGFVYSDGWVDDARLVVLCAVDARERGARVITRARCVSAARVDDPASGPHWRLDLVDRAPSRGGERRVPRQLQARALVNAAGPWVADVLGSALGVGSRRRLRLVKGSHIVVPAVFGHGYAYLLQNPDRRVVFAIPYEERFTLIGTTDVDFDGDPAAAAIDAAEVEYLCASATRFFRRAVAPADVVWSYSGVRPLLDDEAGDASAVTRDWSLELDTAGAPLLSVFGGKITTFRRLAEDAVDRLAAALRRDAPAWTEAASLPGGDVAGGDVEALAADLAARRRLPPAVARRLVRAYGSRVDRVLGEAAARWVAPGVSEAELRYLVGEEWAMTAEDVLWRRSKLGLHLDPAERGRIADWFAAGG
jgi:glycerol-3-phosphate dehydrogenase